MPGVLHLGPPQLTSDHQELLKIIVEGELEGTSTIVVFSMKHMNTAQIPRVEQIKMENLSRWFGEEIKELRF
ncbi:MAG: hypothetical protein KDA52_05240 [Planctomycetaceae bacterium]|nr:hypothetical protein [Planctomycetaceae bacterium]